MRILRDVGLNQLEEHVTLDLRIMSLSPMLSIEMI